VAVTDFKINQVSISSSVASDSLAAKSLQKFLNKVEARGVVEKAKGERKKTIIEALAEKQRIKMVVQAWKENGDLGTLIRTLEAMERSTAAFQYAIHDIPGLGELLERIGYPAKQTITRAELIEALKEIVGVKQNKED
jgi:regulator of protease activity HflC (stomatin/prohibitin superfamily)